MAAQKRGNAARKSHATQAHGQASGKKRRGRRGGQAWRQEQDDLHAQGEENWQSFAHSAERAGRAMPRMMERDFTAPMGEGFEQIMRSWMGFFQRAALSQQRLMQDMLELGSGRRVFEAHRSFFDDSLRNLAESTNEVLRASGRIAEPAMRTAERAAGLAEAYGDHDQAQRRSAGNGRGGYDERRPSHAEAARR